MGLIERLGPGPIAVDTSIFIYWIEEHAVYLPEMSRCSSRRPRAGASS